MNDGDSDATPRTLRDARHAHAALLASAHSRRSEVAAHHGVLHAESASYVVAMIPFSEARVSELPRTRRDALEGVLRQNVAAARAIMHADAEIGPETLLSAPLVMHDSDALQHAESELRAAGCAACRGHCCMAGGNHAFNRVETMVRVMRANGAWSDDELVDAYLGFVAEHTMTDGCVYQGAQGCTLSRELRSEICNRYECNGLRMLRGQFDEGQPVRAYFVHREGGELRGGEFVEIARSRTCGSEIG